MVWENLKTTRNIVIVTIIMIKKKKRLQKSTWKNTYKTTHADETLFSQQINPTEWNEWKRKKYDCFVCMNVCLGVVQRTYTHTHTQAHSHWQKHKYKYKEEHTLFYFCSLYVSFTFSLFLGNRNTICDWYER